MPQTRRTEAAGPTATSRRPNRVLSYEERRAQINRLAPWRRRVVWTLMVSRLAGKIAVRRSA